MATLSHINNNICQNNISVAQYHPVYMVHDREGVFAFLFFMWEECVISSRKKRRRDNKREEVEEKEEQEK